MRLWGPRIHGVGGETGGKIAKVIVRVDTDAGIYGLGEVDDFMGVRKAIAYIREYFRGRDPFAINAIVSELLYATLPPHHQEAKHGVLPGGIIACPTSSPTATPLGPVVWAVSGVEMALCDLIGKALQTPAYNLLGGKFRDRIRVYLDRSSPADPTDLDAWRAMAADAAKAGFRQMKFDIDFMASECVPDVWNRSLSLQQINRIVERLKIVRETVGPDFELCVDCHRQYNAPDAVRVAQALAPLDILWLEDPTPETNPDSCAEVRVKSPIPICVGEMFVADQFRVFVERGACDILHPDILFCGGMHEMRRIADYAEVHHLPLAMHGNGGALATVAAAHVAAASRNFLGLEYHFIETPWIGEYVTRDVPLFRAGTGSGIGRNGLPETSRGRRGVVGMKPVAIAIHQKVAAELAARLSIPHTLRTIDTQTDAEIAAMLAETDVLVSGSFKAEWRRAPSSLRLVHSPGVGIDGINLASLPAGCQVCIVHGHERGVAEQAFLLILALQRSLLKHDAALRKGDWLPNPPYLPELRHRHLLILGLGHIGAELARWGNFLEMHVTALTRSPSKARGEKLGLRAVGGLDELGQHLGTADFVVIAVPAAPETVDLIGEKEFQLMKPGAFIINVGRARVINEAALYQALHTRRIAGAGLDVWYDYPDRDDEIRLPSRFPFQKLDNVIMTPHKPIIETMEYRWGKIADTIARFARGEPLPNVAHTAP